MNCLLGIDSGLTVTKAVVFDETGCQLAVARRRVPQLLPQERYVERDMNELWRLTASAIKEALQLSGQPSSAIKAVSVTAHGDGLYLLDKQHQPLGNGILSLDSRAGDIIDAWSQGDESARSLQLTGQMPHVSAPSALLAWMKQVHPEQYEQIGVVLGCKDWLRFCLAGTIGTDRTEASTSFTDVQTQDYSLAALSLFGLEELSDALPPISHSADQTGVVTRAAADVSGLLEGTPVVCGLHDVTASALGIGGHATGIMCMVAGTYSINEVVSNKPSVGQGWFCRNAIDAGRWNNMAISPASTANYDWFIDTFCALERDDAIARQSSIHESLVVEINRALERHSTVMFHPFLFGSPHGNLASGSFLGLRGWHQRGDLIKAVLEGIAFNHRTHVEALKTGFDVQSARLTGGGSRNPAVSQMFADVLDMPVMVTNTEEPAAYAAALCAGTAIGLFDSVDDNPRGDNIVDKVYEPAQARSGAYAERFDLYSRISETLKPHWNELENLTRGNPDHP